MADTNKVLEGSLKYRDGKKWKQRWCVLQRLSPVADCLHVFLYKEYSECHKSPTKSTIPLEDFFGLQHGFLFDKENHVLAIICRNRVVNLAFHSQETLDCWRLTILQHLGEGKPFEGNLLKAPSSTKIAQGPVNLFVHRSSLCLVTRGTGGLPPHYLGAWRVSDLGRFGITAGKFCFEVEERNGSGVYALDMPQMAEMNQLLLNIAQGRSSDSPPLPPKIRKSSAESNAVKPQVSSPVCKSMSLDRNSVHKSECSKVEVEGTVGDASYTGLRRRMSEPREFVGTASADNLVDSEDKANCYHNLWCCKESAQVTAVADKQASCDDFVGQCFDGVSSLLTDRANHSSRLSSSLSGSLSKICCLPAEHDLKGGKMDRPHGNYINVGKEETGAKENLLSGDKRPSRRLYDDVDRCAEGEQEAESLLEDNHPSGDYVNESTYSAPIPVVPRQGRPPLQQRACEDPLKPLPYVDLRRFDGDVDEGYLYWMKGQQRPDRRKMSSAGSRSREPAKEGVSYTAVRLSSYANMQTPKSGERHVPCDSGMVAVDGQCRVVNGGGRSSYHSSLKRPSKMSLLSSTPPAPSSGSYAELRLDPGTPQSMLRSSSYYNVRLNTVIPPPPRRPENKDKPAIVPRTLPPTPSTPSFVARSMSDAVFTSPSRCRSGSLKADSITAPEVDYIPMCGQMQGDDNAIFFTVNIPPKRDELRPADQHSSNSAESNSTEACPTRSFNALPPAAAVGGDSAGYVDMSGVAADAAAVDVSEGSVEPTMWRPRLRQSRSVEDELDSSPEAEDMRCLVNRRTSHGAIMTGVKWAQTHKGGAARAAADDYVPMEGVLLGARPAHELAQSQVFAKPFDNLISHERFKLPVEARSRGAHVRRDVEDFASDSAINFLSYRSNSVKSSKSSGLFSRFIRRHSAKEKLRPPSTDPQGHDPDSKASAELICVQPASVSNSSSSSSLDRLGPPPPVPIAPQHPAASEKNQSSEHYINLASVSSGLPASLPPSTSDSSTSDYLNLAPPPPLPPKALVLSKNLESDLGFRNCVVPPAVLSEKARVVEKQQLRSITEDEQEVPPLPEKTRNRTQSKLFVPDSPTVSVVGGLDASPKPPVPPRSVTSNVISSGAGVVTTQRSPRLPASPADRESHLVTPDALKSRKPNLTVNIVPTVERRGSDAVAMTMKGPVQLRHLSDLRLSCRSRMVSDLSSVSISSGEEGRPSPALTTMRPRYGKEYQCVDRRRLLEESSPFTPQRSPSVASTVFTFDVHNVVSRSSASGNCSSSGENSPKYPASLRSRRNNDHVTSSRNVSPIVLDPMLDVSPTPPCVEQNAMLNYAEIDLSSAEPIMATIQRAGSRTDKDRTEYAMIDMVLTSAASRVGREHARQREDILGRKERKAEALSGETKEGKPGNGGRGAPERKGSAEPRRTQSMASSREQRFGLF